MAVAMINSCATIYQFPTDRWNDNKKNTKRIYAIGKSNLTDCLHSAEEIKAVYDVFTNKVIEAKSKSKQKIALRNLTMFVCSISVGLRGGDFCSLKWNDIMDENWNLKLNPDFVPEKTKHAHKHVKLSWNSDFERAMQDWLTYCKETGKVSLNDYIFQSQKSENNHICREQFGRIIEKARKEAGIRQRICTHGCRKTMGNRYYKESGHADALTEMNGCLNHASQRTTSQYLCIEQERINEGKENTAFLYK